MFSQKYFVNFVNKFLFFCLISFTLKYPIFFVWKNCVIKIFRFERKVRFTGKWTQIDVSINKTLNLLENSVDSYSDLHMAKLIFRKLRFAQKFYSQKIIYSNKRQLFLIVPGKVIDSWNCDKNFYIL